MAEVRGGQCGALDMGRHPAAAGGLAHHRADAADRRARGREGPGAVGSPRRSRAGEAHERALDGRCRGRGGARKVAPQLSCAAARQAPERPAPAAVLQADTDIEGLEEVPGGVSRSPVLGGDLEAKLRSQVRLDEDHRFRREQEARGRLQAAAWQHAAVEDRHGLGARAFLLGWRDDATIQGAPFRGGVARVVRAAPRDAPAHRGPPARHSDEGRRCAGVRGRVGRRDAPRRGRSAHGGP
mmetsp:Transcript_60375/g.155599  ORF Transcript_60375/g.155599 Transcript_60375/m.155599 type:complete len:240 (+) Transcript_60375:320-1039(+)